MATSGSSVLTAVYTGMFDPIHLGHYDIIARGAQIFPRVVIGVGVNPEKRPFFAVDERVAMACDVLQALPNVEVQPFTGLTVQFVREVGAKVMIRGLRTVSDMDYEFSMSLTNQTLDPSLQTVFLLARIEYTHLSSTLIRQIAAFGGDLKRFLPASVIPQVEAKAREQPMLPP